MAGVCRTTRGQRSPLTENMLQVQVPTIHTDTGTMLVQRLQRWPSIDPVSARW